MKNNIPYNSRIDKIIENLADLESLVIEELVEKHAFQKSDKMPEYYIENRTMWDRKFTKTHCVDMCYRAFNVLLNDVLWQLKKIKNVKVCTSSLFAVSEEWNDGVICSVGYVIEEPKVE